MAMRPLIIVALTTGCGFVVGTFDSGQVSGTRLKISYFDFDGTRSIEGIYDTTREQRCEPTLWINGRFYCTPTPAEQVVYADATCTHKVALTSNDPCLVPEYLIEYDYSDCNTPVQHLYERGPRVSITQYWYASSHGCLGPVSTRQRPVYAVGSEVATAELAAIDRGLYRGSGRLQRQFLTSPDGLRLLSGQLRDTALNIDCALVGINGGTSGICEPVHDAPISYFQDATCSTPVAATRDDCDAPQVAVQFDTCRASPTYFALGTALSSHSLFFGTPQACQPSAAPPAHDYFSIGEQIDVAAPSRSAASDGRRIEPVRFALDGLLMADRSLYDTQSKAECLPFKLADGNAYCLPFGGSLSTYYTDSRCTIAVGIATVYRGPQGCSQPSPPSYALKERHDQTCANTHEVHRVLDRHIGQLYESQSGGCAKHVTSEDFLLYDVGPPLSLDDFASGSQMIDL